jgi:hypothetical protein
MTLAAQSPQEYCTGLSKLKVESFEACAVGAVYVFDILEVGKCVWLAYGRGGRWGYWCVVVNVVGCLS